MNAFQAYNTRTKKYLNQMPELFGGWNRNKGPKKFYSRAADARGELLNVMSFHEEFNPEEWEIHKMEFKVVEKEPFFR